VIDFHCHLDLYPEPWKVVQGCEEMQIFVLSVTTTPSAWPGTKRLSGDAKRIRTSLGLHPQLANQRKGELRLFYQLLPEAVYVGEIGLDGSPDCRPFWKDQVHVFDQVLSACSDAGGRVMSIHSRHAASEVLDYLERRPESGTPILHWFSGSMKELDRAIRLGCWFSIGLNMLNSEKGRRLVGRMPRDRVLTESDGPFARLEGRSAFPWDVQGAVQALARLWGLTSEETDRTLKGNLRSLVSVL